MIRYSATVALICCYMLGFQACKQKAKTSLDAQYEEEVAVVGYTTADMESISEMANHFSNNYFSIDYPDTYELDRFDGQGTPPDFVVYIVNIQDFSNIIIIVSGTKRQESTSTLIQMGNEEKRKTLPDYQVLRQIDDVELSIAKGSMVEYKWRGANGHLSNQQQYVVKKADNTTYRMTLTWDATHPNEKKELLEILNTIAIK